MKIGGRSPGTGVDCVEVILKPGLERYVLNSLSDRGNWTQALGLEVEFGGLSVPTLAVPRYLFWALALQQV